MSVDTEPYEMVVGDLTSNNRGTGARANKGKLEWHQLPMFALAGSVRVFMYGGKKYTKANWCKGMPWSVVYDCAMRHLMAWQRGEELDSESGLPHLDHALTNLVFLSAYRDLYPEGDDRFAEFAPGGVAKLATDPSPPASPPPTRPPEVVRVVRPTGVSVEYTLYSDGTWAEKQLPP